MADFASTPKPGSAMAARIHQIVLGDIDMSTGRLDKPAAPFWQKLAATGTDLWLDTGDMDAASELYTDEFSALTTNNTLLNAEVQKGIYDDLIAESAKLLTELDDETKVIEIAFILNARHGLRLAQRFGGKVSVELHTALSHDIDRTVAYGLRYFLICPEHFIVKVPLTAAGLIATRRLREYGVPINFTLGFSARQNFLAAHLAKPNWTNVFLGRLNAYIKDNGLGDGNDVGEKATLASQRAMREVSATRKQPTWQIAASMRGAANVAELAGLDVYTMPVKVAAAAKAELDGNFTDQTANDPAVTVADGCRAETIWSISEADRTFAASVRKNVPETGEELIERAHAAGVGDLFPRFSAEDYAHISSDGKIPKHSRWSVRVASGEVSIETLLNLAGLASFTLDQKALDDRIRGLI